jgi:predicted metal-dependent hydrolase
MPFLLRAVPRRGLNHKLNVPKSHVECKTSVLIAKALNGPLNQRVQLEWLFGPRQPAPPDDDWLVAGGRRVRLCFVRNRQARRYILRLRPDGAARVTVPRGGSLAEAKRFAERNMVWLEQQLLRQAMQPRQPLPWPLGTEILFRGQALRLEPVNNGDAEMICLGGELVAVADSGGDLRPAIEQHLRCLAARELPARVFELAALHQLAVKRVTVRNQRSRWGSCSRRGTISLNWRLVQTPPFVRDYLVLHELAHLKEMNHSRRFWSEVAHLCPDFREAERWLKQNSSLLR